MPVPPPYMHPEFFLIKLVFFLIKSVFFSIAVFFKGGVGVDFRGIIVDRFLLFLLLSLL